MSQFYEGAADGKTEAWRDFEPGTQTLAISQYGFPMQWSTLESALLLEANVFPLNCEFLEIPDSVLPSKYLLNK